MPGGSLNKTERQLVKWWERRQQVEMNDSRPAFPYPVLNSMSVDGDPGLRGIKHMQIHCEYPLTAICGCNGSGKSTMLALAALAFHSPSGHLAPNAIRVPSVDESYTYYTFRDFFYKGPTDPDITGVNISWTYYKNGIETDLRIRKRSDKWMHYERRPRRPVYYLDMSRALPAIEQRALRNHFGASKRVIKNAGLDPKYLGYLDRIMGRKYREATDLMVQKHVLRSADYQGTYSGFSMGAGEDIIIGLLLILQDCPDGSLIVIEEIELGLHPQALRALAGALQEIILDKKLQILVSTHSREFLDSIPRQARVLLQRGGTAHTVIQGPTTRFAMTDMRGIAESELNIYCEDEFAKALIEEALPGETLKRVMVIPVGAKSELCRQAKYHENSGHKAKQLLVWDGDVSDDCIQKWARSAEVKISQSVDGGHIPYCKLLGTVPPESWLIEALNCDEGYVLLSRGLKISEVAAVGHVDFLRSVPEPHNIFFELQERTGVSEDVLTRKLLHVVGSLASDPLMIVRQSVLQVLGPSSQDEVAAGSQDM